jgi:hypothetical protein
LERYGLISKEIQGFSAGNNQLESNGTIEVVIASITLTIEDVNFSRY